LLVLAARVAVEMETQVRGMDLRELLTQEVVVAVVVIHLTAQMDLAAKAVQGL
jgi:hypothetical protein